MGSLVPQDPIAGQECHIAGQDCFAAPPPPIAGQGCPGIQLLSPTAPAGPVDFSTSISPNMQVDNDVNHSPAWAPAGPFDFSTSISPKMQVDIDVNHSPAWGQSIFLGLQHFLVMLGTTVVIPNIIVPLMGGNNEDKAKLILNFLFLAGFNTLCQTLCGTRLPIVMGSSYSYLVPVIAIAHRFSMEEPHLRFATSMRALQGSLLLAATFQFLFAAFGAVKLLGMFLNPITVVPLVTLTGFGFLLFGFPHVAICIEVGLPSLITVLVLSQCLPYYLKKRSAFERPAGTVCMIALERFPILLSLGLMWMLAHILSITHAYSNRSLEAQVSCRTERSGLLRDAPSIWIPHPFQWGHPTLRFGDAFPIVAAAFVAIVESVGGFIAASRYGGATPIPPPILRRGVIFQALSTLLNGIFGSATGSTASIENIGLLGMTNVGSRRVIQFSAVFMIIFSTVGKVGVFLALIPFPIFAAWYCILYGYVVSVGFGLLQFTDPNSYKTLSIIGFSVFMGSCLPSFYMTHISSYPNSTSVSIFGLIIHVIVTSPATVAVMIAILLFLTVRGRGGERTSRGLWWLRYVKLDSDETSRGFYGLPSCLDRICHPV